MRIDKTVRYFAPVLVLAVVGRLFFTFYYQTRNDESVVQISQCHEVLEHNFSFKAALLDFESAVKGFALSGEPLIAASIEVKRDSVYHSLRRLRTLTSGNPAERDNMNSLTRLLNQKAVFDTQILKAARVSVAPASQNIEGSNRILDSMQQVLSAIDLTERKLLAQKIRENDEIVSKKQILSVTTGMITLTLFFLALFKVNREINLRKQAEKNSKEKELKYRELVENSSVVIFSTDILGNFTYVNNKCFELTGYTPAELIGSHFSVLLQPHVADEVEAFYKGQLARHTAETQLKFPIKTKNLKEKWVEQTTIVLRKGEKQIGFQSLVKEISQENRAEEILKKAADQYSYQNKLLV